MENFFVCHTPGIKSNRKRFLGERFKWRKALNRIFINTFACSRVLRTSGAETLYTANIWLNVFFGDESEFSVFLVESKRNLGNEQSCLTFASGIGNFVVEESVLTTETVKGEMNVGNGRKCQNLGSQEEFGEFCVRMLNKQLVWWNFGKFLSLWISIFKFSTTEFSIFDFKVQRSCTSLFSRKINDVSFRVYDFKQKIRMWEVKCSTRRNYDSIQHDAIIKIVSSQAHRNYTFSFLHFSFLAF